MARTRTQPAKDTTEETVEVPKGTRPTDLAKDLNVNPKSLRAFLRRTFPRPEDTQGTSWYLNDDQVKAATEHFTAVPDAGDEE